MQGPVIPALARSEISSGQFCTRPHESALMFVTSSSDEQHTMFSSSSPEVDSPWKPKSKPCQASWRAFRSNTRRLTPWGLLHPYCVTCAEQLNGCPNQLLFMPARTPSSESCSALRLVNCRCTCKHRAQQVYMIDCFDMRRQSTAMCCFTDCPFA